MKLKTTDYSSETYEREYASPEIYEREYAYIQDDLQFWVDILKKLKPDNVLELGCGSGRLGKEIHSLVDQYIGTDILEESLAGFKQMYSFVFDNPRNKVEKQDFRSLDLKERFDVIILPFNALAHISDYRDLVSMLNGVKKHLNKDGIFIIDYFNPDFKYLNDSDTENIMNEFELSDGSQMVVHEKSDYNKISQVNHIYRRYENKTNNNIFNVSFKMRIYFPEELRNYLNINDFDTYKIIGDYKMNNIDNQSRKQIIFCKVT